MDLPRDVVQRRLGRAVHDDVERHSDRHAADRRRPGADRDEPRTCARFEQVMQRLEQKNYSDDVDLLQSRRQRRGDRYAPGGRAGTHGELLLEVARWRFENGVGQLCDRLIRDGDEIPASRYL